LGRDVRRFLRRFAGADSGPSSEHLRELSQLARRPNQPVLGQAVEQFIGGVRGLPESAADGLDRDAHRCRCEVDQVWSSP